MKFFICALFFTAVLLMGHAHAAQLELTEAEVLENSSFAVTDSASNEETEALDAANASDRSSESVCHNKPCKKLVCKFIEKDDVDCFAINEDGEKFKASGYGRPKRIQERAMKKCRMDRSSNHCLALGCIM